MSSTTKSRLKAIKRAIKEDDVDKLTAVPQWTSLLSRLPCVVNVMAQFSRVKCLEAVLASDADIDVNSKCVLVGNTPVIEAIIGADVVAIRILLRHGDKRSINLELANNFKFTPLGIACKMSLVAVVKELLTVDDLDLNSWICGEWPPLVCAAMATELSSSDNAHKVVRLLVADARCDVNGKTVLGHTALQLAAEDGLIDVVRELLVDRCDPSIKLSEGRTAIDYAETTEIRTLIYEFTQKHERGRQRAKMTTDSGRIAEIKSAIKEDDAVRLTAVPDWTSLIRRLPFVVNVMVRHNRDNCLETVLASDADVGMDTKEIPLEYEPFIRACGDGNLTAVRTMLRHRDKHPIDIEALSVPFNVSALSSSCCYGRADVVKELLTVADIDLNARVGLGYTPLAVTMMSLAEPDVDANAALNVVRLLVADARCDVNARTSERCLHPGFTALHIAVVLRRIEFVCVLLVDRCDVTIKCAKGVTPMQNCKSVEIRSMLTQFIEERKKRKEGEAKESARLAKIDKEAKEALAAELRAKEERRVAAIRPPPKCAKCSVVGTSVDILLMPCRHLCLCQRCAKKMKKENKHFNCPFPECGEIVQKCHTVYY